jgi:hypothetical protein
MDQVGRLWRIGFHPDWLSRIKISRDLPNGRRRSSHTLYRNPARRAEAQPGRVVRTEISSVDGRIGFRIAVEDPDRIVEEVIVVTRQGGRGRRSEVVKFMIDARLPGPKG